MYGLRASILVSPESDPIGVSQLKHFETLGVLAEDSQWALKKIKEFDMEPGIVQLPEGGLCSWTLFQNN